jgi:CheY-like chemotaxis protein
VCHILIIEDEPILALDLQDLFEAEGATSIAFAVSEADAVASAMAQRPALISSDVKLVSGTGPGAIATIHDRLGAIPVIFITATPEECHPCDPPGVVLGKPLDRRAIRHAFHEMTDA